MSGADTLASAIFVVVLVEVPHGLLFVDAVRRSSSASFSPWLIIVKQPRCVIYGIEGLTSKIQPILSVIAGVVLAHTGSIYLWL